jgi:VanZ family protein
VKAWVTALGPAAAWAAFLFFLSSRESLGLDLTSGLDKVAHFAAYLVLGWLLARAAVRLTHPVWLPVLLGIGYAISDEFHQSFVPGRTATVGDLAADVSGIAVGVLVYLLLLRRRASRTSSAPATALESPT